MTYIRKETYSIEEVLEHAVPRHVKKKAEVDFDGDLIKMNSQRYNLFKQKGTKCVDCGLEGTFFAKERDAYTERYHFNLYGINQYGKEVLMTKDHIIPRSLGGANMLSNYQPMCTICNSNKGAKLVDVS